MNTLRQFANTRTDVHITLLEESDGSDMVVMQGMPAGLQLPN